VLLFCFDSVEVDCQQMFKPGQLGVAMGRVRTTAGLRVINFKEQGCLPQPECINTFVLEPSMPREDSLTCCKVERYVHYKFLEKGACV